MEVSYQSPVVLRFSLRGRYKLGSRDGFALLPSVHILAIWHDALAYGTRRESCRACRVCYWSKRDGTTAMMTGEPCSELSPLEWFTHKGSLKEVAGVAAIVRDVTAASCCVSSMVSLPWLFQWSARCVRNRHTDRFRILLSHPTINAPWA
jgi:hypothetical protein